MEMDSDVVTACKKKLLQFRIKELKDVLTHVGVSKQGKKQDLIDRILALLYDEGTPGVFKNKGDLVKYIDDAYRDMHEVGAASNSKKQNGTGTSRIQRKEESEELHQSERKIRCPCGSSLPSVGPLIQCVDPDCEVWQHINCVIIPERPMEEISTPSQFLCEICRLKRADPFWASMAHPLYPVKLASSNNPAEGSNSIQSVERTFKLTRADRDLLQMAEYDVQAWCMLFNDSVPFRVQWPQYADLHVNGIPIRTVNRSGSQCLGANGRDDGVQITLCITEGINKISLSGSDARIFCLGVRLVRRRTVQEVLGMIPEEADGEPFEHALARVQRCIGGGITTGNDDDSDSDLEVIADSIAVNLRCPMSGSRMKTAGRFRACVHMGCFDLKTFVELNERSKKWQCPICLKNYSVEDVVIDPFFNRILNMMQSCGEEVNEIDMKPNGSWRVRNAREVGDLSQWHRSDCSVDAPSEVKQENVLECNDSKTGMLHNFAGSHGDGPQGICHSFINQQDSDVGYCEQNIITMSSTTSGDGKDDGEQSINQDGKFGIGNSNENEVCSNLYNYGRTHGMNDRGSYPYAAHDDVIVLSDSEDDVSLFFPETLPVDDCANHDGFSLSAPAKVLNSYPDVTSSTVPCVFNLNHNGLLKSQPPCPSNSAGAYGIDFFGASGAIIEDHNSASCCEPVNPMLASDSSMYPVQHGKDLHDHCNSSVDHELASASGNVSLDVFPPCQAVPCNEIPLLNCGSGEDWICLTSGDARNDGTRSDMDIPLESAKENLELRNQVRSEEDCFIQSTTGESGSETAVNVNGKRSDGPFSFPRQRRTVRKRASEVALH